MAKGRVKTKARVKNYDLQGIPVTLTRKRVKNINLRVSRSDANVVVSAPYSVPEAYILGFLLSKIDWIKERHDAARERLLSEQTSFEEHALHPFLGADYPLQFLLSSRPKVELNDGSIKIYGRHDDSTESRQSYLDKWYRSELQGILDDLVPLWAARLDVQVNEYRIKKMKTKWGTCNITDRRIWINLELIKHPFECIEYVVLHELTHLFERHHNERFYAIMTEHMPEWLKWDRLLDQVSS